MGEGVIGVVVSGTGMGAEFGVSSVVNSPTGGVDVTVTGSNSVVSYSFKNCATSSECCSAKA